MKSIGLGARQNEGVTWHPELADRAAKSGNLVRNHLYYALDTCRGDVSILRATVDSCVRHFQNIHGNCAEESVGKEMIMFQIISFLEVPFLRDCSRNFCSL